MVPSSTQVAPTRPATEVAAATAQLGFKDAEAKTDAKVRVHFLFRAGYAALWSCFVNPSGERGITFLCGCPNDNNRRRTKYRRERYEEQTWEGAQTLVAAAL